MAKSFFPHFLFKLGYLAGRTPPELPIFPYLLTGIFVYMENGPFGEHSGPNPGGVDLVGTACPLKNAW